MFFGEREVSSSVFVEVREIEHKKFRGGIIFLCLHSEIFKFIEENLFNEEINNSNNQA